MSYPSGCGNPPDATAAVPGAIRWVHGTPRRISSFGDPGQDSRYYPIGVNFMTTTSELITRQKAAKSNAHARSGQTHRCSDGGMASQISAEVAQAFNFARSRGFPKAKPDGAEAGLAKETETAVTDALLGEGLMQVHRRPAHWRSTAPRWLRRAFLSIRRLRQRALRTAQPRFVRVHESKIDHVRRPHPATQGDHQPACPPYHALTSFLQESWM